MFRRRRFSARSCACRERRLVASPRWLRRSPADEVGEEAECARTAPLEPALAVVPAARWPPAAKDGVGVVAGELAEAPAGAEDDAEDEDEDDEGAPGRFGVFTNGVVPDGAVTEGVVTDGVVADGVLDGVVTDGVLTTGVETLGVVAEGVVTDGVLTVGVGPTGVVTFGVVTEGTVTDGTVACGVVTAGRLPAGVLTVGNPTLGSVAAVPASGWLMSRASAAATPANEQILRMPLERSPAAKLAVSGANRPKSCAPPSPGAQPQVR